MNKEEKSFCEFESNLSKAIDMAVYGNFTARNLQLNNFTVIEGPDEDYAVVNNKALESFEEALIFKLHDDYAKMQFHHIEAIYTDNNPLRHWETIKGIFATQHGEILRFILAMKIPLEKFIRYELASRGHDKDHHWVGFEEARKIWLEDEK